MNEESESDMHILITFKKLGYVEASLHWLGPNQYVKL